MGEESGEGLLVAEGARNRRQSCRHWPPVKGHGGLPCRFDLVFATCDCTAVNPTAPG